MAWTRLDGGSWAPDDRVSHADVYGGIAFQDNCRGRGIYSLCPAYLAGLIRTVRTPTPNQKSLPSNLHDVINTDE